MPANQQKVKPSEPMRRRRTTPANHGFGGLMSELKRGGEDVYKPFGGGEHQQSNHEMLTLSYSSEG